eukprot:8772-Heterococcus_DN1.PRE.1
MTRQTACTACPLLAAGTAAVPNCSVVLAAQCECQYIDEPVDEILLHCAIVEMTKHQCTYTDDAAVHNVSLLELRVQLSTLAVRSDQHW